MTAHVDFQLFNVVTRRLQRSHRTAGNISLAELQCSADPDLGYVLGHWDAATSYVDADGNVVARTAQARSAGLYIDEADDPVAPPEPITKQQINDEAQRRILARYPVLDQLTILRKGGANLATMAAFIDAAVAASNALTARPTIPADFGDDKYWPAASAVASSQTASTLKGKSP